MAISTDAESEHDKIKSLLMIKQTLRKLEMGEDSSIKVMGSGMKQLSLGKKPPAAPLCLLAPFCDLQGMGGGVGDTRILEKK